MRVVQVSFEKSPAKSHCGAVWRMRGHAFQSDSNAFEPMLCCLNCGGWISEETLFEGPGRRTIRECAPSPSPEGSGNYKVPDSKYWRTVQSDKIMEALALWLHCTPGEVLGIVRKMLKEKESLERQLTDWEASDEA